MQNQKFKLITKFKAFRLVDVLNLGNYRKLIKGFYLQETEFEGNSKEEVIIQIMNDEDHWSEYVIQEVITKMFDWD